MTEDTTPIPGARIVGEISLQSSGDSTAITVTCSRGRGPWLSRTVNNLVGRRLMGPRFRKGLSALREQIQREIADGTLQIPEPTNAIAPDVNPATVASSATTNKDG